MKTLQQALETFGGRNGHYVWNYLERLGITDFKDCTIKNISLWLDNLYINLAPNSTRLYAAVLRSVLNRYLPSGVVPSAEVCEILNVPVMKSQKIYLTQEELARLELITPRTSKQRYAQLAFLISSKTGMRLDDTKKITLKDIKNGYLVYVNDRTGKEAIVPVGEKVIKWIEEIKQIKTPPNLANFELAVKDLCKQAGVDEQISVFQAGEVNAAPKWSFVTASTAQVSFCTILAQKGVSIRDIGRMAGHSSPAMTERYIVHTESGLNDAAKQFLDS